jgi:undecaprenyl pyrophosphate synthase
MFNKTVSASYFAVRKEIELLATKLKSSIPRRDDKLINILKYLGKNELAEEVLYLYEKRKDADYSKIEIDEETVYNCLNIAKRLIEEIRKLIS